MGIKVCTEWAEESYQQCNEYRDEGYNACNDWDDHCCDWWPCSWGCKLITWVCVGWYWVSNIVCVAWTTIVTLVCVAWEVISVITAPITLLIEIILALPVIGAIINEIWNVLTEIIARILGIIDVILDIIGIRLLKKLRVCIVILRDERGSPVSSEAILQPHIDAAKDIYLNAANVSFLVEGIHTVSKPSPSYALDGHCDAGAWGDDLWLAGSYYRWVSTTHCTTGGLGRLTGLATPVTVIAIRSIPGSTAGCSLGPLVDYVTLEGPNPLCIAHEIAHACGLWHVDIDGNLANPTCGGTQLKWWQRAIVRNSSHVTYF